MPRLFLYTLLGLSFFFKGFAQQSQPKLVISPLCKGFYIFTTYNMYKGVAVPANGMYVLSEKGAILLDAPWDTTQFQPLLDSIELKHHKKVLLCIGTHSHEDRSGGFEFLNRKGIRTYATVMTDSLCKLNHEKRAAFLMGQDTLFTIGKLEFKTIYPGKGHSSDNIVIWFPKEKVLYGGCFIKSTEANDLGNLADADPQAWPISIANMQGKCPNPKFIIPGHQDWRDTNSTQHTLNLLKHYQKEHKNQN